MAFSNTIIPTFAPATGGGPGLNALQNINAANQQNAQNKILNAEVPYAPYQAYANALLTQQKAQWLPYQYKMQALMNPMIWQIAKDNPALQQQLSNMLNNPMPGMSGGGNANIPPPQSTSNSLLALLFPKLQGNQSADMGASQNALPLTPQSAQSNVSSGGSSVPLPQSSQDSRNLSQYPSMGGPTTSVINRATGPYDEQVHKGGVSYYDPNTGKVISVASPQTVTSNQTAMNAAERVAPQLQRISELAKPFQSLSGTALNQLERGVNFVAPQANLGLPTQYAQYKSIIASAPEALVKSYGLKPTNETIERMQRVIEPYLGETGDQYKTRILNFLENLKQEQIGIAKQQLEQGFELTDNQQSSKPKTVREAINQGAEEYKNSLIQMIGPDGKVYNVPQGKAQRFLQNGFKRYS